MRLAPLTLILALSACAEYPALDARLAEADRAAPYPELEPLEPLLARADASGGRASQTAVAALSARSEGLRARAAGLRGPVLSPATTERLRGGVDTAALQ